MRIFDYNLSTILEAEFADDELFASVGVVQCGDKWLLGLAKADDDRDKHWCFAGGGIKKKNKKNIESAEDAAVREVWEEMGIRCKAVGKPITTMKKGVAFVHCKATRGQTFDNNSEFTAVGWFTRAEMKGLKLYHNVLKLIDRVT